MILLAALGGAALVYSSPRPLMVAPRAHQLGLLSRPAECAPEQELACGFALLKAGKTDLGVAAIRAAADDGDNAARRALGLMLVRGEYVEQDQAAAVRWFRKAAYQGDRQSMSILATVYERGIGVAPDARQSALWRNRAAQ